MATADVRRNDENYGSAPDAAACRLESDVPLRARVSHWRACRFSDVADGGAGVAVRAGRRDPVRLGVDRPCDVAHWSHPGPRLGQRFADPGVAIHLSVAGADAR